jgi:hypothetical protein
MKIIARTNPEESGTQAIYIAVVTRRELSMIATGSMDNRTFSVGEEIDVAENFTRLRKFSSSENSLDDIRQRLLKISDELLPLKDVVSGLVTEDKRIDNKDGT